MKPINREGIAAPAALTVLVLLLWPIAGADWALGVFILGGIALLSHHLYQLARLLDWARGPLDAPVPGGSGIWATAFSAIYHRVKNRAAYERDLQQVLERFQNAAEAIPDGIVLLDSSNRIEWANARARAQLGLTLELDRGRPLVNLLRHPTFVRYIETGAYGESVMVESPRNAATTLLLQLVPFGFEEKLLLSRDVTQVEAAAGMRRDFIANVSHELKSPLTVITGFLETLQELELEPSQRDRYLQLMQDQAGSMQRLVNDLLTLSALESDQNELQETRFAVVPLILELSSDAKALSAGRHNVEVEIGQAAAIVGSREELSSALGNLVSNAIRYTPEGGTIKLVWRIADGGLGEVVVADTGIGIAETHIPRLAERFYRVDRSRSRATGGTGLGLAIVKHVLLRHQGELRVESAPGKGSTFIMRLPSGRVFLLSDPSQQRSIAPDLIESATEADSPLPTMASPLE